MPANIFGAADTFALPNPFQAAQAQPQQQQDPSLPPLTPEEQDSLLSRIGSGALHGLGYVGSTLSKATGGRAIRGALNMLMGGNTPASELLSILPFSDTLGITNPENEVRGSDLLGGNQDTSFFSPEGIGGLGLEMALDPATYLTFGAHALTNLGLKGAAAGAKLPATAAARLAGVTGTEAASLASRLGVPAAEVAGQALGGHVGLKVPFTNIGTAFDLSGVGQMASKIPGAGIASSAADMLKGAYSRTIPPLFEGAVMGQPHPQVQQVARRITENTPEAIAKAQLETFPVAERAMAGGFDSLAGNATLRQMGENALPVTAEGAAVLDPVRDILAKNRLELINQGIPSEQLAQQTIKSGPGAGADLGYLPRQLTPAEPKTFGDYFKTKGIKPQDVPGREEKYLGLTTERIHDLVADPMQGMNKMQITDTIRDQYLGFPNQKYNQMQQMQQTLDSLYQQFAGGNHGVSQQIDQLSQQLKPMQAEWSAVTQQASELANLKAAGKLPEFNNHVLHDFLQKNVRDKLNVMKAQEIHNGFGEFAVPIAQAGPDAVPLTKALEQVGLTMPSVTQNGQQIGGAMQQTLDALVKHGKIPASSGNLALDSLYVDREFVDGMSNLMKAHSVDGLQDLAKAWDSATSLTKAFQTVLWPANHARNQLTALWQNMRVGAFDPTATGPMKLIQPWLDANALTRGEVVPGIASKVPAFAGMTDAEATKEFSRLAKAWDVTKQGAKMHSEFLAPTERAPEQLARLIPGAPERDVGQALKGYAKGFVPTTAAEANPLGVSGVLGAQKDTFAPVKGGRELATTLDDVNRRSVFLAMLEQGKTPEEAFKQSLAAHYDFGNLSQFEKTTMRRLIPYYSWMRQNVPSVLGDIFTNPGGFTGQSIRTAYATEGREPGFVPEYLGSGVAAKLGGVDEAGRQSFLTSTGLPFEDVAQVTRPSDILGMLNPLIKGPLQAMTGRNFFTGRDVTGVAPYFGNEGINNLLSMTPASRFITTGKMLADERINPLEKAVNILGTGRITTADQRQAERNAVESYTQQQLMGNPLVRQFSNIYVPRNQMGQLTPEELRMLQLYQRAQQNRLPR